MMTLLIVVFWIGGLISGMVSTIFLLDLEDIYILQPIKYVLVEIRTECVGIVSRLIISSKRAFRFVSILKFRKTIALPR
jgi:hypothetical protein